MSKTDKTRPTWVQIVDPHNHGWLEVWHDHGRGVLRRPLDNCTLENVDPRVLWSRRSGCSYWSSATATHSGLHPMHSLSEQMYRRKYTRHSRTQWRL